MKLLFDQNLSFKLVAQLADVFPESRHVREIGLQAALDAEVWKFAEIHGYTIVTKDADFGDIGMIRGFPPKVVWIRRGNCDTTEVEKLLRDHATDILNLESVPAAGLLTLY